MIIGHVIGRVTLSVCDPACAAGRWLVVSPVAKENFNTACNQAPSVSSEPSLVVFDNIGAGKGDIIAVVEGAEATAPFDSPIPIDAYNAGIIDTLNYQPAI